MVISPQYSIFLKSYFCGLNELELQFMIKYIYGKGLDLPLNVQYTHDTLNPRNHTTVIQILFDFKQIK